MSSSNRVLGKATGRAQTKQKSCSGEKWKIFVGKMHCRIELCHVMKYFLYFKASLKLQFFHATFVLHNCILPVNKSTRNIDESSKRSVMHVYSGRCKANKLSVDHTHQTKKQQDQSKLRANSWYNWEKFCSDHCEHPAFMNLWVEWNRHTFFLLSLWGISLTFYITNPQALTNPLPLIPKKNLIPHDCFYTQDTCSSIQTRNEHVHR